jgi:1-acyl-sn-glycerol-3-phosphate acyltransferase
MPGKLEYKIRCIFWRMNRPVVWFFIKRKLNFFTAEGSDTVPKPPFVLVANHANFLDPWIVGYQCLDALFIMMNDDGFRGNKFKAWYLRNIGAFPKKKGAHDFKAMKYTLQLLKSGFPVLIFPEGQTSWDGETQPVYSGIEKIIRRAACPLVMMHLQGNFLSKPWWALTARKGKVAVKIKVINPAELSPLSDEHLLETIKTAIYNNDVKNPENKAVQFTGHDMALGLERFLWICPHCNAEDALETSGNVVTCTACSASWEMDPHMNFKPRMQPYTPIGDLHDWTERHKQFVKERLKKIIPGSVITISSNILMQTRGAGGEFVDRVSGTLTLTTNEFLFAPGESGGQIIRWPLEKVEDPVIQLKDIFEFRSNSEYFRFVFDRRSPMKWIYYLRYMRGYEIIEQRGHY